MLGSYSPTWRITFKCCYICALTSQRDLTHPLVITVLFLGTGLFNFPDHLYTYPVVSKWPDPLSPGYLIVSDKSNLVLFWFLFPRQTPQARPFWWQNQSPKAFTLCETWQSPDGLADGNGKGWMDPSWDWMFFMNSTLTAAPVCAELHRDFSLPAYCICT